jgi:hypothetical protein
LDIIDQRASQLRGLLVCYLRDAVKLLTSLNSIKS